MLSTITVYVPKDVLSFCKNFRTENSIKRSRVYNDLVSITISSLLQNTDGLSQFIHHKFSPWWSNQHVRIFPLNDRTKYISINFAKPGSGLPKKKNIPDEYPKYKTPSFPSAVYKKNPFLTPAHARIPFWPRSNRHFLSAATRASVPDKKLANIDEQKPLTKTKTINPPPRSTRSPKAGWDHTATPGRSHFLV